MLELWHCMEIHNEKYEYNERTFKYILSYCAVLLKNAQHNLFRAIFMKFMLGHLIIFRNGAQ